MPFCPKCLTEFRDGFTVCSDCGIALVDEPEAGRKLTRNAVQRIPQQVLLANIYDLVAISYVTSMLQNTGIAYRVIEEDVGQYLTILHGRSYFGKSIYVTEDRFKEAVDILRSYQSEILPEYESDTAAQTCRPSILISFVKVLIWIHFIQGLFTGAI